MSNIAFNWVKPGQSALSVGLCTDVCIAILFRKNCRRTNMSGADEQGMEASEVFLVQQKPGDLSLIHPLQPAQGVPAEQRWHRCLDRGPEMFPAFGAQ